MPPTKFFQFAGYLPTTRERHARALPPQDPTLHERRKQTQQSHPSRKRQWINSSETGCSTMVSLRQRTLSSMRHAYSTSYSTRPVHTLRSTNKLPTTKSLVVLSAALHTFGKTLIHSTAHADSTICFGKQV